MNNRSPWGNVLVTVLFLFTFLLTFQESLYQGGLITTPDKALEATSRNVAEYCVSNYQNCSSNSHCSSGLCLKNLCHAPQMAAGENGAPCRTRDDCYSQICVYNRCLPDTETHRSDVGQRCQFFTQCYSQVCDWDWQICLGSPEQLGTLGSPCRFNNQCLSNRCSPIHYRCLGGPSDLAATGEICTDNYQCFSRSCNQNCGRCK